MPYQFRIQTSAPRTAKPQAVLGQADSLSDVIESLYLPNTEKAYLQWNWISIPLCYKYDISILIDDIVPMINELVAKGAGDYELTWPSDTFRATWRLSWQGGDLEIQAAWESVVGGHDIVKALNNTPFLKMSKNGFLGEWASLLENVVRTVSSQFVPSPANAELDAVRLVLSKVKSRGVPYQV